MYVARTLWMARHFARFVQKTIEMNMMDGCLKDLAGSKIERYLSHGTVLVVDRFYLFWPEDGADLGETKRILQILCSDFFPHLTQKNLWL